MNTGLHCILIAGVISFYIHCTGTGIFQSLDITKLATHYYLGGGENKSPSHTELVTESNSCRLFKYNTKCHI
jgi:hypothetical protein